MASFVLAVDRASKDGGADFLRISAWDRQAELCAAVPAQGGPGGDRRTPAQPVVAGARRHAAQRGRGRREPCRSSSPRRAATARAPRRRSRRRPWPRLRAPWRNETRSSPSPTSCSTLGSFRDYGPMGMQVVGADDVQKIVVRRLRLAGAVRAGGRGGCAARGRPPRPPVGERAAHDRPAHEGPAAGALRRRPDARRLSPGARRPSGDRQQRAARARARAGGRRRVRGHRRRGRFADEPAIGELVSRVSAAVGGREPLVFADGPERRSQRSRDHGRRRPVCLPGGARGLRRPDHRRGGRADDDDRPRARDPLRRRRPLRDGAARRAGSRGTIAERFGVEWEFVELDNPV